MHQRQDGTDAGMWTCEMSAQKGAHCRAVRSCQLLPEEQRSERGPTFFPSDASPLECPQATIVPVDWWMSQCGFPVLSITPQSQVVRSTGRVSEYHTRKYTYKHFRFYCRSVLLLNNCNASQDDICAGYPAGGVLTPDVSSACSPNPNQLASTVLQCVQQWS